MKNRRVRNSLRLLIVAAIVAFSSSVVAASAQTSDTDTAPQTAGEADPTNPVPWKT